MISSADGPSIYADDVFTGGIVAQPLAHVWFDRSAGVALIWSPSQSVVRYKASPNRLKEGAQAPFAGIIFLWHSRCDVDKREP